jgi:hypothetical protein
LPVEARLKYFRQIVGDNGETHIEKAWKAAEAEKRALSKQEADNKQAAVQTAARRVVLAKYTGSVKRQAALRKSNLAKWAKWAKCVDTSTSKRRRRHCISHLTIYSQAGPRCRKLLLSRHLAQIIDNRDMICS